MFGYAPPRITINAAQMRFAMALWLIFCMGATFASPLLRPARFEVVCGTHGKARLIAHDELDFGKARPKNFHHMDCTLCVATAAVPSMESTPVVEQAYEFQTPCSTAPVYAVAANATPPPVRAPPIHVFQFFQPSSERSI